MRKLTIPLLLCSLLSLSTAWAAGQMKPGLWEMAMQSDAMKNMPKIPPEQMEQMEQMRKMGVNVPQMTDGGMVTKVCITKQMADEYTPGMGKNETGCESKNYQHSGNAYSADIVCNGPDMKGQGKAKGTFNGDTSFSSSYDFKGTMGGQPVNQRQETKGKWLGADCGNVKPAGAMMPRK